MENFNFMMAKFKANLSLWKRMSKSFKIGNYENGRHIVELKLLL